MLFHSLLVGMVVLAAAAAATAAAATAVLVLDRRSFLEGCCFDLVTPVGLLVEALLVGALLVGGLLAEGLLAGWGRLACWWDGGAMMGYPGFGWW